MLAMLRRTTELLPRRARAVIYSIPFVRRLYARMLGTPHRAGPKPGELRAVVHLPDWCRWDHMRQRPQAMAKAFADAGHPVYFVDSNEPGTRTVDGVTIVNRLAETPRSGVILFVHYPPLRELFPKYEAPAVVYDILDDLSIFDPDELDHSPERRVRAHHPFVMADADVVTVSAPVLADRHRHERADAVLVENGVDLDRFTDPGPRPGDMPAGKVAGYHGAISHWFDFDIVVSAATALPGWQFVLVGPVLADGAERAPELAAVPNITLLGERTPDEIPAYVAAFDVGMVPFAITDMTEAVSPLKLYEYLACGVPVVSTPLPTAVDSPSTVVASTAADFAAAITAAADPSSEWLQLAAEEAASASWSRRLQPVIERLDSLGVRRA